MNVDAGNYSETGSTGTMKRYYYAGATRVAIRTGSSTLNYLLGDHLGSTSITTNSSGEPPSRPPPNTNRFGGGAERYMPWGENRYTYGSTPTTYRFTGQRVEAGLGLYFYGARWYDASAGRFISADSVIPNNGYGNGDSRRIQIMLIVDYHEMSLLTQLNDLNYHDARNPDIVGRNEEKDFDPLNPSPTKIDRIKRDNRDSYSYERNDEPLIDFNKPNNPWNERDDKQQKETDQKYYGTHSVDLLPTRLNSMNLDRYAYTSNCPTRYTDPSGHCDMGKLLGGGAITFLGGAIGILGLGLTVIGAAELSVGSPTFVGIFVGLHSVSVGVLMAGGGYLIVKAGIQGIVNSDCFNIGNKDS